MSETELRNLARKENLDSFDLLRMLSEMCDGGVTVKAVTTFLSLVSVTRSIANELQNASRVVPFDAFKAWWSGFVSYASSVLPSTPAQPASSTIKSSPQPPTTRAPPPPSSTIKSPPPPSSTIKSPPPPPSSTIKSPPSSTIKSSPPSRNTILSPPQSPTIKSPKESQLNPTRVSMPGSEATWNEKWQTLCDACCGVNHVDSPEGQQAVKLSSEYCEEVMKQVGDMREKVLKRFLCPLNGRDSLNDGFCDRDGCFYNDNGSFFVIPLHVLAWPPAES